MPQLSPPLPPPPLTKWKQRRTPRQVQQLSRLNKLRGKDCSAPSATKKAMNNGKGLCWEHGERKKCEHADCTKLAIRKGFCDEHGMKVLGLMRTKCKSPGCNKQPVKGDVCIAHDAKHDCMILKCYRGQFKEKKCQYHYSLTRPKN
jgi:hypothetical protein